MPRWGWHLPKSTPGVKDVRLSCKLPSLRTRAKARRLFSFFQHRKNLEVTRKRCFPRVFLTAGHATAAVPAVAPTKADMVTLLSTQPIHNHWRRRNEVERYLGLGKQGCGSIFIRACGEGGERRVRKNRLVGDWLGGWFMSPPG